MKKCFIWGLLILFAAFLACESTTPNDEDEEDLTPPDVPTGLAIDNDNTGEDIIALTWDANQESDLQGYHLYRAENDTQDFDLLTSLGEDVTQYADQGVSYDTLYYYALTAFDADNNESAKCEPLSYQPVNVYAPAVPSNFKAYGYNLPNEDPKIELTWQANTETDFSHYNLYKSDQRPFAPDTSNLLTQVTATHYVDQEVSIGVIAYYMLTAVDIGGKEGNPTTIQEDQPLPQPQLTSPANNATADDIRPTFQWERVTGATKYEVIVQTSAYSGEIWVGEVEQPSSGDSVEKRMPSDPGLEADTKYYWKVAVFSSDNTAANSYSDTYSFWTPSK